MSGPRTAHNRHPRRSSKRPTINAGPWQWHIQETFKGLIALSIEALKALLLINGGAAVAILAYLGSVTGRSPSAHLPIIKTALMCFAAGVLATALAFIVAYFTQFQLYTEERSRHRRQPFHQRHGIGIAIATFLVSGAALPFALGCWNASSAFQ